jgi:hypothetical protein
MNRLGLMQQGGKNVILAFIMLVAATRAVEATYKLHDNSFRTPPKPPMPPLRPRAPAPLPAK